MSLRDQLQELANPAPLVQIADEDENNIETAAQVVDFDENDDEPSSLGFSTLRNKNLVLLSEDDGRYFGKKISRKQVKEAQGFISQSDDSEFSEGASNDGVTSEDDEEHDSQDVMGEEDSEEENDVSADETGKSVPSETPPSIKTFSKYSFDEDREKGDHIKAQLNLYQMLMECRIKLQKAISLSNQLPQHETHPLFKTQGGHLFAEVSGKCVKSSERLLNKLYDIQTDLLAQHPETKYVVKSDLEETSDGTGYNEEKVTDEEFSEGQDEKEALEDRRNVAIKRKRDIDEYPEMLKLRHQALAKFRTTTINKWYQKVSIASKNNAFKGFETPALKQIEQILNDKNKLIKRTQLKRIPFEIMGKSDSAHEGESANDISEIRDLHLEDYDVEIFEDSDFYHRNLREIIEMKTSSSTSDPSTSGKQFLEIQKLRSKLKRKVNTGASKGRKIRYDVIPKLTNFMAPFNDSPMTDESKNDLFNSLFGKIPIRTNALEI